MEQADWDELKEQMDSPYGSMKLKCDDFEIDLVQMTESAKKTWFTHIYVDGVIKGEWRCSHVSNKPGPDAEEVLRFMHKKSIPLHNKLEIAYYRKVHGKRHADKMSEIKFITYDPYWKSFNSLKKHLVANNKEITRLH